jgi:sialate O-acetylesterase
MGNIPFLYVQLANYLATSSIPKNVDNWAILRDEQTKTLKMVPNTAMASAIDIGEWNNVHPRNKEDVGKRLFIAADNVGYGNNRIANGPMLNYIEKQEGKLVVNYLNADNGLTTKAGNKVKGFAVADEKGVWRWVDAIIDGNKVIINTAGVANPIAVQYAWQSNPETNLYNIEGLPSIPFNSKINP